MQLTPEDRIRAVELSKRVAIVLVLGINVGNLILRFTTHVPQIVVVLIFFASIIPYLIHLHYVEPRLMRSEKK